MSKALNRRLGSDSSASAQSELLRELDTSPVQADITFSRPPACLYLLVGGGRSFLMFFREEGDAGFSSRNPSSVSEEPVSFILENGQRDEFPHSWTYPAQDGLRAMRTFIESGRIPDELAWHNDSGDGSLSPMNGPN